MRELFILALIAAVGYLAYDDFYKQRPALQQMQSEIQQLRQSPARVSLRAVPTRTPPAWFQKRLDEGSAIEQSRQHQRQGELQSTPHP